MVAVPSLAAPRFTARAPGLARASVLSPDPEFTARAPGLARTSVPSPDLELNRQERQGRQEGSRGSGLARREHSVRGSRSSAVLLRSMAPLAILAVRSGVAWRSPVASTTTGAGLAILAARSGTGCDGE